MKLSELIKKLQTIEEIHGDKEVYVNKDFRESLLGTFTTLKEIEVRSYQKGRTDILELWLGTTGCKSCDETTIQTIL